MSKYSTDTSLTALKHQFSEVRPLLKPATVAAIEERLQQFERDAMVASTAAAVVPPATLVMRPGQPPRPLNATYFILKP